MPLIYQSIIRRDDLKRNPDVCYIFGDNVQRRGLKGQAAEMRGEPNAIGVATKWAPSFKPDAYFDDKDYDRIADIISDDLAKVCAQLQRNKIVVWPADGIGTGLSRLPETAPRIWAELEEARKELEKM